MLQCLLTIPRGAGSNLQGEIFFFLQCRISEWTLMSISEHFRYWNDVFQSDIFVSDIGITDVDVGCRISPTLRSMSMPTYGYFMSLQGHGLIIDNVFFLQIAVAPFFVNQNQICFFFLLQGDRHGYDYSNLQLATGINVVTRVRNMLKFAIFSAQVKYIAGDIRPRKSCVIQLLVPVHCKRIVAWDLHWKSFHLAFTVEALLGEELCKSLQGCNFTQRQTSFLLKNVYSLFNKKIHISFIQNIHTKHSFCHSLLVHSCSIWRDSGYLKSQNQQW